MWWFEWRFLNICSELIGIIETQKDEKSRLYKNLNLLPLYNRKPLIKEETQSYWP